MSDDESAAESKRAEKRNRRFKKDFAWAMVRDLPDGAIERLCQRGDG